MTVGVDRKAVATIFSFLVAFIAPGAPAAAFQDVRELLPDRGSEFTKALGSGAGFSFKYGGQQIGPDLPAEWSSGKAEESKTGTTRVSFRHASGLLVVREARVFKGFNAIEYKLVFRNTSDKPLAALSHINALHLIFDETLTQGSCVISSQGGYDDNYFPPRNFSLQERCLLPDSVKGLSLVDLSTMGGRSSDKDMPFFLIHNGSKQEGAFVALGWSGQWRAVVAANASDKTPLQLRGWVPEVEISLEPGEEIQSPTVLMGFYSGSVYEGSNRLRRLIRNEYTPKLNGKPMLPVATYNAWPFVEGVNETSLRASADAAADLGQEYFLVDAGWFEGDNFHTSVGNWEAVNRKKFPSGLGSLADYVRSKGLKFGLWFELERVAAGTWIAVHHPDWVLWDHKGDPEPWYAHVPWLTNLMGPVDATKPEVMGLLDFGRPEVQRYVRDLLDRYIRDYGLKYIRYDFNIDPLAYWRASDVPGRKGLRQIRHVEGLYAVLDWVRQHHPDTIIENCASGGRRIDLGTISRSHTMWIDDQSRSAGIVRHHLQGINRFLPGNYSYVAFFPPAMDQETSEIDDFAVQSRFAGAFGISDGTLIDPWTPPMRAQLRHHVEVWKELRRYLVEDYYPLGEEQPRDLQKWSGWQFHDPADQSGFIQSFRTRAPESTYRFVLHGLDENARYRFTDAYSATSFEVTGATAMRGGIELEQAPMSSRVLMYKRQTD